MASAEKTSRGIWMCRTGLGSNARCSGCRKHAGWDDRHTPTRLFSRVGVLRQWPPWTFYALEIQPNSTRGLLRRAALSRARTHLNARGSLVQYLGHGSHQGAHRMPGTYSPPCFESSSLATDRIRGAPLQRAMEPVRAGDAAPQLRDRGQNGDRCAGVLLCSHDPSLRDHHGRKRCRVRRDAFQAGGRTSELHLDGPTLRYVGFRAGARRTDVPAQARAFGLPSAPDDYETANTLDSVVRLGHIGIRVSWGKSHRASPEWRQVAAFVDVERTAYQSAILTEYGSRQWTDSSQQDAMAVIQL